MCTVHCVCAYFLVLDDCAVETQRVHLNGWNLIRDAFDLRSFRVCLCVLWLWFLEEARAQVKDPLPKKPAAGKGSPGPPWGIQNGRLKHVRDGAPKAAAPRDRFGRIVAEWTLHLRNVRIGSERKDCVESLRIGWIGADRKGCPLCGC